jgi:hypothetical protein
VLDRGLRRREAELEADNIILQARISVLNAEFAILKPGPKKKAVRKKRNLNTEFSNSRAIISKKKRMVDAERALEAAKKVINNVIDSKKRQKKEKITLKLKI